MSEGEFHIFSIVEGEGEVESLCSLLHRIYHSADCPFVLRTVKYPYRVPNGLFFYNSERRRRAFHWAAKMVRKYGNGGVLILMDADTSCCRNVLNNDNKMQGVRADIASILADVPNLFVLAEKGYESWLVAGLGGLNEAQNNPSHWLKNNPDKSGLPGTYRKIHDQRDLTISKRFDIDRATMSNTSFRRLRERVLAMAQATSDTRP